MLNQLMMYTSLPALLMAIGGVLAFIKAPGEKATSFIQHFAAGVVFAAVAAELLPTMMAHEIRWVIVLGFSLGVGAMFLVDAIGDHFEESNSDGQKFPFGLVITVAIDVFIDGLLIGVAFLASQKSGLVIACALALEVLFLGLATATSLVEVMKQKWRGIAIIIMIALLIPVGAYLGYTLVSDLSSNIQLGIIAFGVAALLYLVTEELLIEAHEVPETRLGTMAFFVGFLVVVFLA